MPAVVTSTMPVVPARWIDYGAEHQYIGEDGHILGRVAKIGCCWRAFLGVNGSTCGKYHELRDAKRALERLLTVVHA